MSKRKVELEDDMLFEAKDKLHKPEAASKHTLDSDEEDSGEDEAQYNILDEDDIEGEEDGIPRVDGQVKITPFNMKEELEEGHFDGDGHYLWNKDKEIKDNWLDNIDWVKIKTKTDTKNKAQTSKGLGDSDSSDEEEAEESASKFNFAETYRGMLALMQPKETVKKALQRLGKATAKISTLQRWKNKKAGIVDNSSELVTELTALSNEILTRSGNMDIYDETYEMIERKIKNSGASSSKTRAADDLDMYADDFDSKEKEKLTDGQTEDESPAVPEELEEKKSVLMWEYKVKQDDEQIYGPHTSEQMQKYVEEGHFKDGAVVRKVGDDDSKFYSLARIDFDLYL